MRKIFSGIVKDLWIILLDIIAVNASYFLALMIRFYVNGELRGIAAQLYLPAFWHFAPFYTVLAILVFAVLQLYGGMWMYAGLNDMNRIIYASAITTVIQVIGTCLFVRRMPITYYVIGSLLQFGFVSIIRFGYRVFLVEKMKISNRNTSTVPSMIIGAGEGARRAINFLEGTPFRTTVLIDEESAGKTLNGIEIAKSFEEKIKSVRAVFITDPNLNPEDRKEIKERCEEEGIELHDYTGIFMNLGGRIPVTGLMELVNGKVTLVIDGKETEYENGTEALKNLKDRYDIKSISEAKIELRKPSSAAYVGYEAWAQQYKEQTGEDVSFF